MALSDPAAVDAAVIAKLVSDTGAGSLSVLMPDGVWFDVAASGKTRFVIISLLAHEDGGMFNGRAYEKFTYLVKAVALSGHVDAVKTAAVRIDVLLENAALTPTGYSLMTLNRVERVRYTEVDEDNNDLRWIHGGGHYECWVSPN